MKTIKTLFCICVSVCGLMLSAWASAWTDPNTGIAWTYTIKNNQASLGSGVSYGSCAISKSTAGALTIPSTLGGCPVTSIGDYAFNNCSKLTSVTIPSGVSNIGDSAFYACSGMNSVTIPLSVTNIGSYAFEDCRGLASVTIPSSVTSIGNSAFSYCSGLASVTIPPSVTSIGNSAFDGCSGLTSVTVPGRRCRIDFSSVTNLVISEGTTNIDSSAFYGCSGLKSVTISDGVRNIGYSAFYGCKGLKSVTVPSSVTNISSFAFGQCGGLTSVMISKGVATLGDGAFISCTNLTSVVLPEGLDKLAQYLFENCNRLSSISIPSSVKDIGNYAFHNCKELTSVSISASVTNVNMTAFRGCSDLKKFSVETDNPSYSSQNGLLLSKDGKTLITGVNGDVTIPQGVMQCTNGAFYEFSGLKSVVIPSSVTNIGIRTFYGCSMLTSASIAAGVTSICNDAFLGCSNLVSVTIPTSVTSIGKDAFSGCSVVTSQKGIVVVDGCVLGVNGTCPSTVVLSNDVRLVADSAFSGCSGLTSLTLPSGVESIGGAAFYGCGLKTVEIPSSVRSIGLGAFKGCAIVFDGDAPDVKGSNRPVFSESTATVSFSSHGWDDDGDGLWEGVVLKYTDLPSRGSSEWVSSYDEGVGTVFSNGAFDGKGESWLEMTMTNDVKVVFDCMASTLVLNNKVINTFSCFTNGVEVLTLSGNTDWQSLSFEVAAGTTIGWCYSQTATYGTDFENCGKVRKLMTYPKVTIAFSSEEPVEGELPADLVIYADEKVALPDNAHFERECCSFKGWTDGSQTYSSGEDYFGTNGNASLTAVWQENHLQPLNIAAETIYAARSQQVTISSLDENVTIYYAIGTEPFKQYEAPFEVTGEATIRAYSTKSNYFNSVTNEVSVSRQKYNVTFSAGEHGHVTEGEVVQNVYYGDNAKPVAIEADKWYTFVGWDGTMIAIVSNMNFTAQYLLKEFNLKFGDIDVSWKYGDTLVGPTLTKERHRFIGWSYQGTNYLAGTALPFDGEDVNYTAVWEEKRLSPPVLDMPSFYDGESCEVSASAQNGATIHCKIDDGDWFDYVGPFEIVGSAMITAYATEEDWFDSSCVTRSVVRGPWTFGEYLNASNVIFAVSSAQAWQRTNEVDGVSGYFLVSEGRGDNVTNTLLATFSGRGKISFRFRASVESWAGIMDFDSFVFRDNGKTLASWSGETGWQEVSFDLTEDGDHLVSWAYEKDGGHDMEVDFENCVWLDTVSWTPTELLPKLDNPTPEQISNVFTKASAKDQKLAVNITTGTEYANFCDWTKSVKLSDRETIAGAANVLSAPYAWLSYALGSEMLIDNLPSAEDIQIDTFESSGKEGQYDFTVSIKDVEVGSEASADNLKKVLGLEGGTSLQSLSTDNVNLTFDTPEDGKVKFTAGPKDIDAKSFFMRVKLTP